MFQLSRIMPYGVGLKFGGEERDGPGTVHTKGLYKGWVGITLAHAWT